MNYMLPLKQCNLVFAIVREKERTLYYLQHVVEFHLHFERVL